MWRREDEKHPGKTKKLLIKMSRVNQKRRKKLNQTSVLAVETQFTIEKRRKG